MKLMRLFLGFSISILTLTGLSGCNNGDEGLISGPELSEDVVELIVAPKNSSVPVGLSQTFRAEALLFDGQILDVTNRSETSWESSNESVATVNSNGLVSTISSGTVTITASNDTNGILFSDTATLEVTDAIVTSLNVTPSSGTTPIGLTKSFIANVTLSNGETFDVTDEATLNWNSSNTNVATISNAIGTKGVATGENSGTTTITASSEVNGISFTDSATLEVTDAIVTSLNVTPSSETTPIGLTKSFIANVTLSSGETFDVTDEATLNWSSSNTNIATISNAIGTKGVATGESSGITTITASGELNGISFIDTAILEVTDVTITSLTVTPSSETTPIGLTKPFIANVTLSNGETLDITDQAALNWSSSSTFVATISNTIGTKGIATGENNGSTTIKASGEVNGVSFSNTASLRVTEAVVTSITLEPRSAATRIDSRRQFIATATYSDGDISDITKSEELIWTSSDPTIATVYASSSDNQVGFDGTSGVSEGKRSGDIKITASINGVESNQVDLSISDDAPLESTSIIVGDLLYDRPPTENEANIIGAPYNKVEIHDDGIRSPVGIVGVAYSQSQAADFCSIQGKRLPTLSELKSLFDATNVYSGQYAYELYLSYDIPLQYQDFWSSDKDETGTRGIAGRLTRWWDGGLEVVDSSVGGLSAICVSPVGL
ncbi:hypothetical protein A9261_15070 [Vibrio tasmaniensis]|nr:hypothetical protein A9261_15070 [Vibrio tasmaniensis]